MNNQNTKSAPPGLVLHAARGYDLLLWLVNFGRERAFREKLLSFASLMPGETVLDVGCGTGTLAIAAKRQVGESGEVYGIDASPEMLSRAGKKAGRAGVEVTFKQALAQSLPFPDARFDVVLSTVMLHHLPKKPRSECVREIRRVLKPAGRVLAVDFDSSQEPNSLLSHLHRRHGHVSVQDMMELFSAAGFCVVERGAVGVRSLHFVLAKPIVGVQGPQSEAKIIAKDSPEGTRTAAC